MEVRAQWTTGKRWYIATIEKANGDGTFYLLYNDGGIWPRCPGKIPSSYVYAISCLFVVLQETYFPHRSQQDHEKT